MGAVLRELFSGGTLFSRYTKKCSFCSQESISSGMPARRKPSRIRSPSCRNIAGQGLHSGEGLVLSNACDIASIAPASSPN
jgi:hypothetical protein